MMRLFIFFIFSFSSFCFADAPPVILEEGKDFYELGLHLDLLEDPTRKLTIEDVSAPKWSNKFKRSQKKVPNYGFSKSAYWARVRIQKKASDHRSWLISQNYASQDEVKFFKKVKGTWVVSKTGDIYPFSSRKIPVRAFLFPIKFKVNALYFVRIEGAVNRMNLTLRHPLICL